MKLRILIFILFFLAPCFALNGKQCKESKLSPQSVLSRTAQSIGSMRKELGPEPQGKFPEPLIPGVTIRTVWLCRDTSYNQGFNEVAKAGLYQVAVDKNQRHCLTHFGVFHLIKGSTEKGEIPITREIMKALAPVINLQKEAVEALKPGQGWKLHLNFDYKNKNTVLEIKKILGELKKAGVIYDFKIGGGGGVKDDQPGKEATVYIGHGALVRKVASYLEENHSNLLEFPTSQTLKDDLLFTPKIVGRFDAGYWDGRGGDKDFLMYGAKGIPFLMEDGGPWGKRKEEEARNFAIQILRERYGAFFAAGLPKAIETPKGRPDFDKWLIPPADYFVACSL